MLQTVLFPKDKFSLEKAIRWLEEHKYKHNKVDTTEHFHRFRQTPPFALATGHKFYTKKLSNGIDLVYMNI